MLWIIKDTNEYFKKSQVINFDIIHRQAREKKLRRDY